VSVDSCRRPRGARLPCPPRPRLRLTGPPV